MKYYVDADTLQSREFSDFKTALLYMSGKFSSTLSSDVDTVHVTAERGLLMITRFDESSDWLLPDLVQKLYTTFVPVEMFGTDGFFMEHGLPPSIRRVTVWPTAAPPVPDESLEVPPWLRQGLEQLSLWGVGNTEGVNVLRQYVRKILMNGWRFCDGKIVDVSGDEDVCRTVIICP